MKRIHCKTLCTGKGFQLHRDLYTDGTININLCGAKNLFQYIMFCNRSFSFFLKLLVKQLVVTNIINFFFTQLVT